MKNNGGMEKETIKRLIGRRESKNPFNRFGQMNDCREI